MHFVLQALLFLSLPLSLLANSRAPTFDVHVLSESPRIFAIDHFLSDSECDHIIREAKDQLQRSTVVAADSAEGAISPLRTSKGMFFEYSNDRVLKRIEGRISKLLQMPLENGEGLQVLHYEAGTEFRPHYDFFDPSTTGGAIQYNRGGQRLVTLIMYLHTTEQGGETIFPEANVKVKAVKGNAVLFYNCKPNGEEDFLTLHGGAPVLSGEKWIATKWFRQGPFQ